MSIVYDNYYITPTVPYNLKSGEYNLSGYWINGITGEIKHIKTKEHINVKIYPKNRFVKTVSREEFNK